MISFTPSSTGSSVVSDQRFEAAISMPSVASWVAFFEANRQTAVADGTAISTLVDSSGNARNATQSGAARPTYKVAANGINGQPVIRFAGSQYLQTVDGGASLTSSFYYCAVVKFTSVTGTQTVMGTGDESNGERRLLIKQNSNSTPAFNGFNADVNPSGFAVVVGTTCFLEIIRSGTTVTVYKDGVSIGSGTPSLAAYANNALTIGANNAGGETLLADLAMCGFIGSAPSASTLLSIRNYVAETYGLNLFNTTVGNFTFVDDDGKLSSDSGFKNGELFELVKTNPLGSSYGKNVLRLKQTDTTGYATIYGVGSDVTDGTEGYGFAAGWGNANALAPFGTSACFEVYNALSTTFYPFRVVQTNSGGFRRRIELETGVGNPGDLVIFNGSANYPSEGEHTRFFRAGGLSIGGGSDPGVGGLNVAGNVQFAKTITAAATTGAQTINKPAGSVNFAAAATSLVVTNSLVTASSVIICTVGTNDTTLKSVAAVAGSGSFTLHANAAATAETRVNFLIIN